MKVKVAAVQPRSFWGPEEYRNAAGALEYVDQQSEEAKPEERENKTYGAGPVRRVVAPRR
ncbi:MAG: hypothetical protein ACM3S0_00930 [Acidobacteriota bacterium]